MQTKPPLTLEPGKDEPTAVRVRASLGRFGNVLGIASVGVVVVAAVFGGISIRRYFWDLAEPIRFKGDLHNAINWGSRANDQGLWRMYDRLVEKAGDGGQYHLDYAPLRLMIATGWVRYTRANIENGGEWQNTYEFHKPMLWLNFACQLVAAVGIGVLVGMWVRRSEPPGPPGPASKWPAWWWGLAAALLLWFNPAVLWNAHAWPQWDTWVLPFLMWGLVFMSKRWALAAGLVIGFGALAKGQILLVTGAIALWPLFAGRPLDSLRFGVGLVIGIGLAGLPFTGREVSLFAWVTTVAAVPLAVALCRRWHWEGEPGWRGAMYQAGVIAIVLWLVMWPWVGWLGHHRAGLMVGLIVVTLAGSGVWLWQTRVGGLLIAAAVATALFAGVLVFDGSLNWLRIGLYYPTEHHRGMSIGPASNLSALLDIRFDLHLDDPAFSIPDNSTLGHIIGPHQVGIRPLLRTAFGLTLVLTALGMGLAERRGDRRILAAFVAPWVLMFALLPQMHERYLLWAAAVSAMLIALRTKGLLLWAAITLIAWEMMVQPMLNYDPSFAPWLGRNLKQTHPDIGWAVLVIAGILLYLALAPGRHTARRADAA